jgi:hypothetical protein
MKFSRIDLITRANAEIQRRKDDAERTTESEDRKYRLQRDNYVSRTGVDWLNFADAIRDKVHHKLPITLDDVPAGIKDSYHKVRLWNTDEPRPTTAHTADLEQLVRVLETITDEFVTTASLKDAGLPNVARLF